MIRDRIKFYEDYSEFNPCTFCHKTNHLLLNCPKLFYIPDKDFHIKKFNYSPCQSRKTVTRTFSHKKPLNALNDLAKIQAAMLKYHENVSLDDIPEIEDGSLSLKDFDELEESKIKEDQEAQTFFRETMKKNSFLPKESRKELLFEKKSRKKSDCKILEETNESVIK